jgi:folate-binding protein YgfZ
MLVKLEDRIVLKIAGESVENILKFLQQITSNNLSKDDMILIYTLFLSGNGKFLFDGFIFHDDEFVYLDCLLETKDSLVLHMKKYKARLNIKIENAKYFTYQNFGNLNFSDDAIVVFDDPRSKNLGKRIYSLNKIEKDAENIGKYHDRRVELNISEGCYEMVYEQSFPIHFRMHEINAVSLSKGCYLGQEPTNRLFRTGILRKEIAPFVLNKKNPTLKKGDRIESGVICSIFEDKFGFLMHEKEDFNIDKL